MMHEAESEAVFFTPLEVEHWHVSSKVRLLSEKRGLVTWKLNEIHLWPRYFRCLKLTAGVNDNDSMNE
jgi:hypothetical protein